MKKVVLALGSFFLLTGAFAQGPYAALQFGYAMGSSTEMIGTDFNQTSATTYSSKAVYGTYGSGIPISVNLGYMFTQHLGFDLGINYFMGSTVTSDMQKSFLGDDVTTTSQGYQIRILPQLVVSTGNENSVNFYSKFGLVMPVAGETTFKKEGTTFTGVNTQSILVEGTSTGNFSIGFNGAFGANYSLNENLSIFGELQAINLRVKNATQTLTKYELGGTDLLSSFTTNSIETEYVSELNENSNSSVDEPTKTLGSSTNYNSFGINLGIKYNF